MLSLRLVSIATFTVVVGGLRRDAVLHRHLLLLVYIHLEEGDLSRRGVLVCEFFKDGADHVTWTALND